MKVTDLTQPWGINAWSWVGYPNPKLYYHKTLDTDRVNAQMIETPTHCSTHFDGPRHFVSNGQDIASMSLNDYLCGEGVIVDISDSVGEWDIIKPSHITEKMGIREKDILIIYTGFHKYSQEGEEANAEKYMLKHPGPYREFLEWALKKDIKWIGMDCPSLDHPMNGGIRNIRADIREEYEEKIGKSVLDIFDKKDYHLMHNKAFPKGLLHLENAGGDIEKVLDKRTYIGCFPMKIEEGESAPCRLVTIEE